MELLTAMQGDPLLFGKACLPGMFQVRSPLFHSEIVAAAWRKNSFTNIIAPRGHAKSSIIACVLPLWHLFFEDGNKVIVLVSKTEGHAIRLLQTIKNALEYSKELQMMFGYWGEFSSKRWRDNEIVLKDNTLIVCRGQNQHVIGLKHGHQRPTLIILDDPEDLNNTKTAEAMENNLRWLLQALIPSRDPNRFRVVVIGTPQHERCMIETLKSMSGWLTLHYSAIQVDGTPLWPNWWSLEKLLAEKAQYESIGRVSSFYREYMCQIIGDEDQLFREEYLRYWDGRLDVLHSGTKTLTLTHLGNKPTELFLLERPLVKRVFIFTGVDPASSVAQSADYSAILSIAIDFKRDRYVLPYFHQRISPLGLADAVQQRWELYRSENTRIESTGYQEMLREYLMSREYIPGLAIKETPRTAKSNRLETLQPFFAQHKIFLKPDMTALINELLFYPRGRNDDLLDALYYANKNVYSPDSDEIDVMEDKMAGFSYMFGKHKVDKVQW